MRPFIAGCSGGKALREREIIELLKLRKSWAWHCPNVISKPCGSWLASEWGQHILHHLCLTHRHRWQASSHLFISVVGIPTPQAYLPSFTRVQPRVMIRCVAIG